MRSLGQKAVPCDLFGELRHHALDTAEGPADKLAAAVQPGQYGRIGERARRMVFGAPAHSGLLVPALPAGGSSELVVGTSVQDAPRPSRPEGWRDPDQPPMRSKRSTP